MERYSTRLDFYGFETVGHEYAKSTKRSCKFESSCADGDTPKQLINRRPFHLLITQQVRISIAATGEIQINILAAPPCQDSVLHSRPVDN